MSLESNHAPSLGSPRLLMWLQCVLGLIALLLLPAAWSMQPVWKLESRTLLILALIGSAYVAAIVTLYVGERRGRRASVRQIVLVVAALFFPVLLAVRLYDPEFSRFVSLASPLLAVALVWLVLSVRAWPRAKLVALGLLGAIAVALQVSLLARVTNPPLMQKFQVSSSRYELTVTEYRNFVPRSFTEEGGISSFLDRYLWATGDGDLYVFNRAEDTGKLDIERLKQRVPLNAAEFSAAMAGIPVALEWFRVADVLVQETTEGVRIFASHHFWKADQQCFVMRVSLLEGSPQEIISGSQNGWRTVYETSPCLPVVAKGKAPRFEGLENGGRMVMFSDHQLLLTVGDHGLDGWAANTRAAQDLSGAYGKTILIDLNSGSSEIFTLGHRNPQGLFIASSGAIWSTEHGPQGGDELNLLQRGGNYGWPLATYGVDYGTHAWPLQGVPGSHDEITRPFYSWVPSLGVSNLVEMTGSRFANWRGDLIISSLKAREIWRLRVRDNRVVMSERIPVDERIRDIIVGHRGELVALTGRSSIVFIEPAGKDEVSGPSLYRVCAACHVPPDGQTYAVGPTLKGIVGRHVASVAGFQYSGAMARAGGVWTEDRLDRFLADPGAVVPGSTMQFSGMADANSRRKLIEFLATADGELDKHPGPGDL